MEDIKMVNCFLYGADTLFRYVFCKYEMGFKYIQHVLVLI
jgi:hypothetical protein